MTLTLTPLLLGLGPQELIIILIILLLLFGGSRLAGLGKSSGRALKEFKEETRGLRDEPKTTDAPSGSHPLPPAQINGVESAPTASPYGQQAPQQPYQQPAPQQPYQQAPQPYQQAPQPYQQSPHTQQPYPPVPNNLSDPSADVRRDV